MVTTATSAVHEEKVENGPGSKIIYSSEGEAGEVRREECYKGWREREREKDGCLCGGVRECW